MYTSAVRSVLSDARPAARKGHGCWARATHSALYSRHEVASSEVGDLFSEDRDHNRTEDRGSVKLQSLKSTSSTVFITRHSFSQMEYCSM